MKPRAALAALIGIAAVLGVSSLAWACTNFATLNLSGSTGPAGTEVVATGSNAPANVPVVLRWNTRSGPAAAEVTTDASGAYRVPVRVPANVNGVQFLLATDNAGNVARAAFEVTVDGAPAKGLASGAAFRSDPSPGTDYLALGTGFLALALLAAVPVAGGLLLWRRPAVAPSAVRTGGER